jgi:hypothetical protein
MSYSPLPRMAPERRSVAAPSPKLPAPCGSSIGRHSQLSGTWFPIGPGSGCNLHPSRQDILSPYSPELVSSNPWIGPPAVPSQTNRITISPLPQTRISSYRIPPIFESSEVATTSMSGASRLTISCSEAKAERGQVESYSTFRFDENLPDAARLDMLHSKTTLSSPLPRTRARCKRTRVQSVPTH